MVYGYSKRSSESERNSDASSGDGDGKTQITTNERRVYLKSNQEEEET